jgi:hypothetical protein
MMILWLGKQEKLGNRFCCLGLGRCVGRSLGWTRDEGWRGGIKGLEVWRAGRDDPLRHIGYGPGDVVPARVCPETGQAAI